jgi:hypothetical protein
MKGPHQKVIRTTVTLHPTLFLAFPGVASKAGYSGLSDYLQAKIRIDAGLETIPEST